MHKIEYKEIAREIAEESIVLLKNENATLPLNQRARIALFGRTQNKLIISGNGSGASSKNKNSELPDALKRAGIDLVSDLETFYDKKNESDTDSGESSIFGEMGIDMESLAEMVHSGVMYELFGQYRAPLEEYDVPDQLIKASRKETDTAIFIIGRNSGGEECDRHVENDYYLTEEERLLLNKITTNFSHVIVIVNANGVIDLEEISNCSNINAILFIGIPGQEGVDAVTNILTGKVSPSGKLAFTFAKKYEDYPTAKHFTWNKDDEKEILTYDSYGLQLENIEEDKKLPVTVYQESIYLGYRYFDSFHKKVTFPFGFGLSYANFEILSETIQKKNGEIIIPITVKNTSNCSGKEIIQLYISSETEGMEQVFQELKGYVKTPKIEAHHEKQVELKLDLTELAHYEEASATWVIKKGTYYLRIGNSSDNTSLVGAISIETDIVVEQCKNRISINPDFIEKIDFMANETIRAELQSTKKIIVTETDIKVQKIINEVLEAPVVSKLSIEELAALSVGYGPGTPFAGLGSDEVNTIFSENGDPITENTHPKQFNGYTSPAIKKYGIKSVMYQDGPAGIGLTAWPTEMIMACSFNDDLLYLWGLAAGREAAANQVNIWLAPAINLHRNPLGGRNFEYFSEDPFLSGRMALMVSKGVQENSTVLVCPKHFAINEQETYRRGNHKKGFAAVDSIIKERTARELYLKPFEMLIKGTDIYSLMTSFNKINGVFAAGNLDLCKGILRDEWGYQGVVVTDWGDMDDFVDGADAIHAGNDIVMPGGPPVIRQILAGYKEGRVERKDLEKAVNNLLFMISQTKVIEIDEQLSV